MLPSDREPGLGRSLDDPPTMDDESFDRLLDVVDLDHGSVGEPHRPSVSQLTATLGIERCAVEDDLDVIASAQRQARRHRRAGSRARTPSLANSV